MMSRALLAQFPAVLWSSALPETSANPLATAAPKPMHAPAARRKTPQTKFVVIDTPNATAPLTIPATPPVMLANPLINAPVT